MTLVVILTVRRDALEAFRSFEDAAAAVMAKHGGAIERTVVVPDENRADLVREVHVITFPSERAFAAYRADPELERVRHLRDLSVVQTDVLVGEDGPDYGRRRRTTGNAPPS